jgi:hypothetical protein
MRKPYLPLLALQPVSTFLTTKSETPCALSMPNTMSKLSTGLQEKRFAHVVLGLIPCNCMHTCWYF